MKTTRTSQTIHLYSIGEEILNSISHGIGTILSIIGISFLISKSQNSDSWHTISYLIFGTGLIFLYLSSTLYHSITNTTSKKFLKKLDHSAIFILIAATYTPFMLINLRNSIIGWSIFIIIWAIALIGIIFKLTGVVKSQKSSTFLYLIMGWLIVFVAHEMFIVLSPLSLFLLFLGGLCYTVGVIFYLWKRLPYNHAIWHFFVLGGSTFHYFSISFSF